MILVPLLNPKFAIVFCGTACANFGFGAECLAAEIDRVEGTGMSPTKSEDAIGAKGRPFTGAEYLASLRDGREVYVYGERVEDVTTHPAFRNAARSIARLYDALHDPKTQGSARPGPPTPGRAASPTSSSAPRARATS